MMLDHDLRLARWCEENDGIVTTDEWAGSGASPSALKRRTAAALLVREQTGVYRHAAHPRTFETRLRAAISAAGDHAYVSGPSLMRLYQVRGEWPEWPEITLLGTEHLELHGVHIRRLDRIEPHDVHRRHGLPVLAPPLGLLLLGASMSRLKVQTALHDMVFQGFTARPQLIDTLVRYAGRGRRGTVSYRLAVRSLDPNGRATQTNLELRVLRATLEEKLAEPHLQLPVVDGDGRRRRLDIAWPEQMLDVETDGDRWHLSPQDKVTMAARDAALAAVGWTTVRVGSAEVDTDLRAVIARIRLFFGS